MKAHKMNGRLFGKYLLDCMEEWIEQNPDEYVNPFMIGGIIQHIEEYQQIESDVVDKWYSDMWGY